MGYLQSIANVLKRILLGSEWTHIREEEGTEQRTEGQPPSPTAWSPGTAGSQKESALDLGRGHALLSPLPTAGCQNYEVKCVFFRATSQWPLPCSMGNTHMSSEPYSAWMSPKHLGVSFTSHFRHTRVLCLLGTSVGREMLGDMAEVSTVSPHLRGGRGMGLGWRSRHCLGNCFPSRVFQAS